MKKRLLLSLTIFTVSFATIYASEVKTSGNWYSSTFTSSGHVSVGTTNQSSNHSFTFKLKDTNSGEIFYTNTQTLSSGSEFNSGRRAAWIGTHVQGQVLTSSTSHSPWTWTGAYE